jgi:hypothetical protein
MTEEQFIEKVKKQSGYIGVLDAWRLIHFFTNKWGVFYTEFSIEDELVYMWLKLQEERTKYCSKCDKDLSLDEFHNNNASSDGKFAYCKTCCSNYRKKKNENRKK